ncbi:MAG: DUF3391 domain-containing protein [Burkholderiaceae bacterium]|nr:DUF3391 domain-containing protein [Burkholderiaceae bacterium]
MAAVMQFTQSTEPIDVSALRLGMFIHLEGGWLSHPFPRSSFKITSEDQLLTLRSLGIGTLRWSPDLSDPEALPTSFSAAPAVAAETVNPAELDAIDARIARRAALSAQRQALAECERQFSEATRASKRVFDSVVSHPIQACQGAQALTRELVDKMLGSEALCIRLLSEAAGDKASAHAVNVSVISLLMGRIFGLAEAEMLDLGLGALLHDIGKADIPERFRHRDDHHTTAEQKLYETHVVHGIAQARRMDLGAGAATVIAQHHELIDGSGFPLKLTSDRTSVPSRIVALVNRYDNLCNPASNPGKAVTPHEAVALMFAQGKNKYDPAILGAFIKMMGVYPAGSVVQLTDDRYALVVGVNSSRPLKPRVLVHEPGVPRDEAMILDLETVGSLGIRRSLKPTALPEQALSYLSPRPRISYFFESVRDLEPIR